LPWYVGGLVVVVGLRLWSALGLAVAVNMCTHPVLWWVLAPQPALLHTLVAEAVAVVVEWALLAVAVRRDLAVLGLLSFGANVSSLLIGLLVSGWAGQAGVAAAVAVFAAASGSPAP
jgi:hypothetical protein